MRVDVPAEPFEKRSELHGTVVRPVPEPLEGADAQKTLNIAVRFSIQRCNCHGYAKPARRRVAFPLLPSGGILLHRMVLLIAGLAAFSFLLSVVLTGLVKRVAPAVGFVDRPGHRKIHHIPKPLGGGIAIFLAIVIPLAGGLLIANSVDFSQVRGAVADALSLHQGGMKQQTPAALKLILAMFLMHLMGIIDDRKALGPYVKLIGQFAIVGGLVWWADLRALTVLDQYTGGRAASILITILWIVGITNAFNFLDNMDALSAGVAAVCTLAFLITALSIGQWFVAAMLALLLGSLGGFLCYNFPPASIFMGDSGSLLIGLLLGVLTIRTTYVHRPLAEGWYAVLAPLVVLAVPLYDLIVVSAIRLSRGKSPFVGDTNHFSHRLVARGMSRRTAVLCIWLVTAATSAAAIVLPHVENAWAAGMIFAQTVLILGVVMLLEQHPLPMNGDEATERRSEDGGHAQDARATQMQKRAGNRVPRESE